ncbi:hypothetical protein FISHEDRAFT_77403 [Fistulina hepatica ATCC 64428]|uniref:DUF6532 domain-containing protein n=1 Tax=Fistulina hepatica ATCC 64428 TaxID=1128425 RepID=A0A0D7A1A4_9AGAR|nr:hypothetical protein FISHEDRAFT_77403 [Fistulina hepatica ATCC 64428]
MSQRQNLANLSKAKAKSSQTRALKKADELQEYEALQRTPRPRRAAMVSALQNKVWLQTSGEENAGVPDGSKRVLSTKRTHASRQQLSSDSEDGTTAQSLQRSPKKKTRLEVSAAKKTASNAMHEDREAVLPAQISKKLSPSTRRGGPVDVPNDSGDSDAVNYSAPRLKAAAPQAVAARSTAPSQALPTNKTGPTRKVNRIHEDSEDDRADMVVHDAQNASCASESGDDDDDDDVDNIEAWMKVQAVDKTTDDDHQNATSPPASDDIDDGGDDVSNVDTSRSNAVGTFAPTDSDDLLNFTDDGLAGDSEATYRSNHQLGKAVRATMRQRSHSDVPKTSKRALAVRAEKPEIMNNEELASSSDSAEYSPPAAPSTPVKRRQAENHCDGRTEFKEETDVKPLIVWSPSAMINGRTKPGKRVDKLKQPAHLQEVLDESIKQELKLLFFVHPFPEQANQDYARKIRKRLRSIAEKKGYNSIARRLSEDATFGEQLAGTVLLRLQTIRGKVKACAHEKIDGRYELDGSVDDVKAAVEHLCGQGFPFIYPVVPSGFASDGTKPFQHPAILKTLQAFFFTSSSLSYSRQFRNEFKTTQPDTLGCEDVEVPGPLLILVAAAVVSAIRDYQFGRVAKDKRFEAEDAYTDYLALSKVLDTVRANKPRKYHDMMAGMYKEFAGSKRHSTAQVGDNDHRHIALLDLENM